MTRSDGQVLEKLPDEGHKIWYRREDSKHQYRVAFILRKEVVGSAISCIPISSRLISIQISARPHNITVIQVYAPTSKHEVEKVEQCYEQFDNLGKEPQEGNTCRSVGQGDWDANVGPDAYRHWAGTVGKIGIKETNDRGW